MKPDFPIVFLFAAVSIFCLWSCSNDDGIDTLVKVEGSDNNDSDGNPDGGSGGVKSDAKQILEFTFKKTDNPSLVDDIVATVNDTDKTVNASVRLGTAITGLKPTIAVSKGATLDKGSGEMHDFSKVVEYRVTAEDGSVEVYEVQVEVGTMTDREILLEFYTANSGTGWDWDLNDMSMQSWNGVALDALGERVTRLSLVGKGVSVLPNSFCFLTTLEELDLYGNEITQLPAQIGNLTSLQQLTLTQNSLIQLPKEIGQLNNLKYLRLIRNEITTLPSEIGNMASLEVLDISYNALQNLPAEIGGMTDLEELHLSQNNLTSIPVGIGALNKLEYLSLDKNQLNALPNEIGALPKLEVLALHKNQLTTIPTEMGNLSSLQDFYLNGNQLTAIPVEIGSLTGLFSIDLSDNKLVSIPQAVCDLATLHEVRIDKDAGVICE